MSNTAIGKFSYTLTHTASPSGASTVEFTGLTSDYSSYMIVIVDWDPSADSTINIRTSTNNGSSYDSNSADYYYVVGGHGSITAQTSTTATEITLQESIAGGTSTNETTSAIIWLYGPSSTTFTWVHAFYSANNNAGQIDSGWSTGARRSAADVDAIQLYPSSGTFSGEIRVYGIREN